MHLNIAAGGRYCHMAESPDKWHKGWPRNQKHKTTRVPSISFATYKAAHDGSQEAHGVHLLNPPRLPFLKHLQRLAGKVPTFC